MPITGTQRVILLPRQVKQCQEFSLDSARSQQQIEFGNHRTKPRPVHELARDNLIGKLAEVAFAEFLQKRFSIQTYLDFGIYPRGIWDKDDFNLHGKAVDIKSTRSGGRWLLIELNKLEFRKKEDKLPAYFLFAVTGWNRNLDTPTGSIELKGYARLSQICHVNQIGVVPHNTRICEGIPNTQYLATGEFIPNTNTRLQADNCARRVSDLETNWTKLIEETEATVKLH